MAGTFSPGTQEFAAASAHAWLRDPWFRAE